MNKSEYKPSKLALAFFHWYCRREFREEIEGDLMERFSTNSKQYGPTKANRLFFKDVILLFRPTIIGNFYQLTHTETMMMTKQNKRLITILAIAISILLIPLIAMTFTNEVNWQIFDFLVAGILLIGTGITIEFILRKVKVKRYRTLFIAGSILVLILIWAELAVGIFGTAFAGS